MLLIGELDFLALIFIVVYVRAIAVLFLFVIIILNVKVSEAKRNMIYHLPIRAALSLVFIFETVLVRISRPILKIPVEAKINCPTYMT